MLVLPNAWDCVSSRLFEQADLSAIATTSGGIAAVLGYPDGKRMSSGTNFWMPSCSSSWVAASRSIPTLWRLTASSNLAAFDWRCRHKKLGYAQTTALPRVNEGDEQ